MFLQLTAINHENTEEIESKVVLNTKKLPMTIKSPIIIVGLTEEVSVMSVWAWLFSVI